MTKVLPCLTDVHFFLMEEGRAPLTVFEGHCQFTFPFPPFFDVNGCLLPWKNHITYFIFIISGCRKWMLKIALYFFLDKKEGMEIFFRSAILVASTTWEVLKKGLLKLNSSHWNLTSTWRCIWTLKMFHHIEEEINLNEIISVVFSHELGKKLF